MKLSFTFVFLFLTFASKNIYAQFYNQTSRFLKANSVWAFSKNAGLDFNGSSPTPISTEINNMEGHASVSHPVTGQLLFYSDGGKCWDRNNQIMTNGDSLFGNSAIHTNSMFGFPKADYGSSVQGVCIVPMIDSPGKYYLFSLMGMTNSGSYGNGTLFYSVVDMSLNNGLGDIVSSNKNILLDSDTLSESMIAIPGNCGDIWLMVHAYEKHEFKAYHITSEGVNTIPVISTTSPYPDRYGYFTGAMACSPDRSMIAIVSNIGFNFLGQNKFSIAKFDANTGLVSDAIFLDSYASYGICFSTDNSKLYVNQGPGLYQYDLSIYDSTAIVSSGISMNATGLFYLKLYNGKIYFGKQQGKGDFISTINNPNLSGAACDLDTASILMPLNTIGVIGGWQNLPNDVVYPIPADTVFTLLLDTTACNAEFTLEALSGFNEYYWDDGSILSERDITSPGTYWVFSKNSCQARVDTFIVSSLDFIPPVITVKVLELGTVDPYTTYQWLLNGNVIQGATQRYFIVSENGDYQVVVSNEQGCIDTSEVYKVTNAEETGITDINSLKHQIRIYPNPSSGMLYINAPVAVNLSIYSIEGKFVKQIQKIKQIPLHEMAEGIYFLHVYDQDDNLLKVEKIVKHHKVY